MVSFDSDYNNGAHPLVLRRLMETNDERTATYGFDVYTERAKEKIRSLCKMSEADVFLLAGGTQTNATVIDAVLRSYEAVLSADTGHIYVHEAGAVEAFGHKVIPLPCEHAKLNAEVLQQYMEVFVGDESRDHMAQPGMVYITFPTELGTLYSSAEIEAIYQVCRVYDLRLFVDGARLGYGLMSEICDFTMDWLARHCDVFYIGGTKVGTLCGEAVVFTNMRAPKCFFSVVKRHGALLAKGRLAGVQFDALFTDVEVDGRREPLYFSISRHAVKMSRRLRSILTNCGLPPYLDSPTNQQFVVVDNDTVRRLEREVGFIRWSPVGSTHTLCRFVTCWATTDEELDALEAALKRILG